MTAYKNKDEAQRFYRQTYSQDPGGKEKQKFHQY